MRWRQQSGPYGRKKSKIWGRDFLDFWGYGLHGASQAFWRGSDLFTSLYGFSWRNGGNETCRYPWFCPLFPIKVFELLIARPFVVMRK